MKKITSIILIALSLCFLSTVSFADTVWVDVRSIEEYTENHIEGDENIPLATITATSLASMFNKGDEINLYCRSGNRAGQAKEILEAAGFTNVNNVGGIDEVRELRNIAAQNSSQ